MNRIAQTAEWIGTLRGWRRALFAFVLGSLLTLGLAPALLLIVLPLSLAPFLWIMRGVEDLKAAFFSGWMFGSGFLWAGLYWISFSMLVDAERFAWAIPFGTLVLPLSIALIWGVAASVMWLLKGRKPISPLLFSVVMTAAEWLRGHIFTGLPWNLPGYSFAATDGLLQVASLIGAYGLTFVAFFAGSAASDLGGPNRSVGRRCAPLFASLLALLGLQLWGGARLQANPPEFLDGPFVRILQPNIPQAEKWPLEFRVRNFATYRDLAGRQSAKAITHLIMPEVALPYLLADDPGAAETVGQFVSEDGFVISGTIRRSEDATGVVQSFNSIVVINGRGGIEATYDKMHLVPFGEYLPLRFLLASMGLDKIVFGPSDYVSGQGPVTLEVPGLPPVRMLICYEGIFPDEVSLTPKAALLINVTNDAWFGQTAGPWQHFQMERMRAVEQGVPLLRAANTGISAVIDPSGRVLAELALGTTGVIDHALPKALEDETLYRRYGDFPLLGFLAVILIWRLIAAFFWRQRRHESA